MLAQILVWSVCTGFTFLDIKRLFPDCYPWWSGWDWTVGWVNFRASLVLTFNGVCDQLSGNGLVLLVIATLAPVEVALFVTLRTVANIALQGTAVILYPVVPDLVRFHFSKEPKKILAVIDVSWAAGCSMVCLFFVAGVPVLRPLYEFWTQKTLRFDFCLFGLLATSVAIRQWTNPMYSYISGINWLQPQIVSVLARAIFTLGTASIFLSHYGIVSAGWGMLLGEILSAIVLYVYCRSLFMKLGSRFRMSSGMLSLAQVAVLGAAYMLAVSQAANIFVLSFCSVILLLILSFAQFILLDDEVKQRLISLVR